MSETLLENIMDAAREITGAEQSKAVDSDLKVVKSVNEYARAPKLQAYIDSNLRRAMDKNEAIITNNVITDPAEAPSTNTSFSDLRIIVAMPVAGHGAVYLEKHIRDGMIERETIDKLMRMVADLLDSGEQTPDSETLIRQFNAMA